MEAKQQNVALTYGLISALAFVIFSVILYIGGIKLYMSGFAYLGYVILILMAVLAATKQKKLNGGYLEFSQALKITFGVLVLSLLAQTIFTYFLLNFIDTNFKTVLTQASLEKAEAMMRKFGVSDDQLEKAMDGERAKDQFSFGRMMLGFAFSCIFVFLIALIISAIVKKKKPEFDNFPNPSQPA